MKPRVLLLRLCAATFILSQAALALSAESPAQLAVGWGKVVGECKTVVTIQVCPEPPMCRGKPTHDAIYKAFRDFEPDYARL